MLLLDTERKQIIEELQKINIENKLDLIDLLRRYYHHEYATVFDKELEEKICLAKSKCTGTYSNNDNYDIRRYSFFLLEKYIPQKFNIDNYYTDIDTLKIIIFFEHIIKMFADNNEDTKTKNNNIKEALIVYSFYKGLISNEICQLSKFDNALRILGFIGLTQESLDDDKLRCMHDFIAKLVLDYYLVRFINEYKNYL